MDFLKPFVLPVGPRAAERHGPVDLYPPDDTSRPRPGVLIVHGGPVPAEVRPTPRDWPVYRGYASLVATRGVVGATVDHRLHNPGAHLMAADDVRAAVEALRADPRVDGERIALWFFSGGGLLSADWLREPPPWLRCVALTYPVLVPFPGWPVDPRFHPVDAVGSAGDLPIVLTRAGRDNPVINEGIASFLSAAKTRPDVVEVPRGRHGFDYLDDDDASRAAVERATDLVLATMI